MTPIKPFRGVGLLKLRELQRKYREIAESIKKAIVKLR
jgi:hypothetical protein